MITTQDIYTALKTRLSTDFSDITNQIKDLKNPERPCIYVEYVESHDREVAEDTIETNSQFNIVYFSEEQTLLDLTNIEKRLRQSLKKPLSVEYAVSNNESVIKFLDFTEIECEVFEDDYILECSFAFNFLQNADVNNPYDEYENNEIMYELDINYKEE